MIAPRQHLHMDATDLEILNRNWQAIQLAAQRACERSRRQPGEVAILPVTKYVSSELARGLYQLGMRDFGESTVQELLRKRDSLPDLPGIRWHLIGHLQRNKVGKALAAAASIHSLDSWSLAQEIDKKKAKNPLQPIKFFIEINVEQEDSKTGLPFEQTFPVLERLRSATSLWNDLAGLMAMAPLTEEIEAARPYFRRLRELRDEAAARGLLPQPAGLSMGMSADFTVAIEEGATVVRIGSRFFEGIKVH